MNKAFAHNPILPKGNFIPDVEARQWADGRVYLYGSHDIGGREYYCSTEYHVYSSADLVDWTDHGVAFRSAGEGDGVDWSDCDLYAPDCICRDGRYYLYFCLSDGSEGVAESDSPAGPFVNATRISGMDGIDPGVFIDDDGQAYIYWGQFDKVRGARLKDNMREIDESTVFQPLSVAEHNFHEGSSMRKRNGIYYYVYADTGRHGERPTCLGYATSTSPLGPFTYRGVIIDNFGSDPSVWNNHGSIAEVNGQWYVFYHRSTRNGYYSRKVCMEPITFNADGTIPEVGMTSQGPGGPLDARRILEGQIACLLSGNVRVGSDAMGNEVLGGIRTDDHAAYRYLDFGKGVSRFTATFTGSGRCSVGIRLDSPVGPLVGTAVFDGSFNADGYGAATCGIAGADGIHALYLVFEGEHGTDPPNLVSFSFSD